MEEDYGDLCLKLGQSDGNEIKMRSIGFFKCRWLKLGEEGKGESTPISKERSCMFMGNFKKKPYAERYDSVL